MKDLLSKEHYFYVIHNLLMKSSTYPSTYIDNPCIDYPPFLQENLDLYVLWFFKNRNSIKKGSSHYVKGIFNIIRNGYTFLHKGGEWILYFFVVSVKFLVILSLFYARWLVDLFCSEQLAMFFFTELAIYECIWNSLTSYCLMIKVR